MDIIAGKLIGSDKCLYKGLFSDDKLKGKQLKFEFLQARRGGSTSFEEKKD